MARAGHLGAAVKDELNGEVDVGTLVVGAVGDLDAVRERGHGAVRPARPAVLRDVLVEVLGEVIVTLDVGPDEVLRHLVLLHVLVGARARGLLALVVAGHVLEGVEDLGARGRRGEISGDVRCEHLQVAEDEGARDASRGGTGGAARREDRDERRKDVRRMLHGARLGFQRSPSARDRVDKRRPLGGIKSPRNQKPAESALVLVSDEPNRSRAAQRHVVR